MTYRFRAATSDEVPFIWKIIHQAITRRREDGSNQWQDGYPNEDVIKDDIERGIGYVLTDEIDIIGYSAVLINDEPEYGNIIGEWLTKGDFVVAHRVAISESYIGKGMARRMFGLIEEYALSNDVHSIKMDTNFDNDAMLHLFDKLGYTYCGKVHFRGSERLAFEKKLAR